MLGTPRFSRRNARDVAQPRRRREGVERGYCAAHFYSPARAAFRDFDGFWEFVAGPLNAGSFGPNALDGTFGPQVVFFKAPPPGRSNLSPFSGLQFLGEVNIDAYSAEMSVDLRDINGLSVFSKTLQPRMN